MMLSYYLKQILIVDDKPENSKSSTISNNINPKKIKVNQIKILENYLRSYAMEPEEVLIMESIANSLDAKAFTIKVTLKGDCLSVEDDGEGMTRDDFENHFAALAITSKEEGKGIGWAGIGAKLYLPVSRLLYVESQKDDSQGEAFASKLWVKQDEVVYDYVSPEILTHAGTYYEVKLRPEHNLDVKKIKEIIMKHYKGILLKFYGDKRILVNGEEVEPFSSKYDKRWEQNSLSKYGNIKTIIYLLDSQLKEPYGIDFVVYGKSIHKDIEKFLPPEVNIKPEYKNRIVVLVIADMLSKILTTNKEDIYSSKNPRLWASVQNKVSNTLKNALIAEKLASENQVQFDEKRFVITEVENIISKILQNPSFRDYNPFLSSFPSKTYVQSTSEDNVGIKPVDGMQKVPGTLGGASEGEGVPTEGPELGTGWVPDENSKTKGELIERTRRTGLKIAYSDLKNSDKESEIRGDTLVINTSAPQYILADKNNRVFEHTMRCVFMSLIEYKDGSQNVSVSEAFNKLRAFYMEWAKVELGSK